MCIRDRHTPEFSFEKEPANVQDALRDLKVTYPVPIDSNYRIWQSFNNEYWPAPVSYTHLVGHNLPQEAPQAFAQAVIDVDAY